MPAMAAGELSEEQARVLAEFAEIRGYAARGPFIPLLRSPRLFARARALGDYLRFGSALPADLRELAILITARKWDQPYEWNAHYPHALTAGLSPAIADAIGRGDRPPALSLSRDQSAVHDFCTALLADGRVTDETYARVASCLTDPLVIDLIALVGYYSLLAMMLNVARTPPPMPTLHALPARVLTST